MTHHLRSLLLASSLVVGCGPGATWDEAFDATGAGAMSGVWGSGADDVWVVGGEAGRGTAFHHDGTGWSEVIDLPATGLLVWVHGSGPDDVWAVGEGGAVVHYDGASWTQLDVGTTETLWGVFGVAPGDVWIVGGDVRSGEPVMIHVEGDTVTPHAVDMANNPVGAASLFKVYGIGSELFAVGQHGLILQQAPDDAWSVVDAGSEADDDFVSVAGTSATSMVAVGGRSSARLATWDGAAWTTMSPEGVPGLSGVDTLDASTAVVAGLQGYVATVDLDEGTVAPEAPSTTHDLHAVWHDGAGATYVVGGRFFEPYEGVALVRRGD